MKVELVSSYLAGASGIDAADRCLKWDLTESTTDGDYMPSQQQGNFVFSATLPKHSLNLTEQALQDPVLCGLMRRPRYHRLFRSHFFT